MFELKVDVLTDNYPAETSWRLINECTGNEVDQLQLGDDYPTYAAAATQHSNKYCIQSARYKFRMLDSYGDGKDDSSGLINSISFPRNTILKNPCFKSRIRFMLWLRKRQLLCLL